MNRLWVLLVLLAAVLACDGPLRDTGYVGTWKGYEGSGSTISIRERDGLYIFRWVGNDKNRQILCDSDGICQEYANGVPVYQFEFRPTPLGEDGSLRFRVIGTPMDARSTPLQYVDQLELSDDSLELAVYTIERNGKLLEHPAGPRRFKKTSNRPK